MAERISLVCDFTLHSAMNWMCLTPHPNSSVEILMPNVIEWGLWEFVRFRLGLEDEVLRMGVSVLRSKDQGASAETHEKTKIQEQDHLDFHLPEWWDINFCCFKPQSLWYFIIATRASCWKLSILPHSVNSTYMGVYLVALNIYEYIWHKPTQKWSLYPPYTIYKLMVKFSSSRKHDRVQALKILKNFYEDWFFIIIESFLSPYKFLNS